MSPKYTDMGNLECHFGFMHFKATKWGGRHCSILGRKEWMHVMFGRTDVREFGKDPFLPIFIFGTGDRWQVLFLQGIHLEVGRHLRTVTWCEKVQETLYYLIYL